VGVFGGAPADGFGDGLHVGEVLTGAGGAQHIRGGGQSDRPGDGRQRAGGPARDVLRADPPDLPRIRVGAAPAPATRRRGGHEGLLLDRGGLIRRRHGLGLPHVLTVIGLAGFVCFVVVGGVVDLPTEGGEPVPPRIDSLRPRAGLDADRGHDLGQPFGLGDVSVRRVVGVADRVERRNGLLLQGAQRLIVEVAEALRGEFDDLGEQQEPHPGQVTGQARSGAGEGRTLHGGYLLVSAGAVAPGPQPAMPTVAD
jgi:hypothetical protein